MVGYIQDAVAKALSDWATLKTANVMPVRANEGNSVVINTPLPAVIIHIVGTDGDGNTFIGGGIRQYFDLELWTLIDVPNYSFSPDRGLQATKLDVSDDVIRCVEHPNFLSNIKQVHDLNMQFDRMETETTYGTKGSINVTVDIHKVIYNCSVYFNPLDAEYNAWVELERIEIDNNGVNNTILGYRKLTTSAVGAGTITPESGLVAKGSAVEIVCEPVDILLTVLDRIEVNGIVVAITSPYNLIADEDSNVVAYFIAL